MVAIKAVTHFSISVSDVPKSTRFYMTTKGALDDLRAHGVEITFEEDR